jgi:hypothetical protein
MPHGSPPGTRIPESIPFQTQFQKIEEKIMKVRISALIAILALAAWLPVQAQQAATPSATAPQTQAPATPDEKNKDAAAHGCCHPKAQAGQEATDPKQDHAAMGCCHGKDAAKASCCAGKETKDMAACCEKKDATGKTAMDCCKSMKDTMCAAKDAKACCGDMAAKDGKGCCAGMADHCAAHASGK